METANYKTDCAIAQSGHCPQEVGRFSLPTPNTVYSSLGFLVDFTVSNNGHSKFILFLMNFHPF
jgi:hypothetical protein